ncbi:MAG: multicopper oxidase domain-containing protein [Actinocrinis sp.]
MAESLTDAADAAGSQAAGYRRLPLAGSSAPRPRRRRHVAAAAVVAAYLVAALAAITAHRLLPVPMWLALHLLVLGAATNAVFVWSRHFAQAFLHARLGSETPAHVRLALLNAGIVSVLTGVALPLTALAVVGAGLVVVAVIAHTVSLVAMARAATLPGRLRVTVRYYVAGGVSLALGASLGAVLASDAAQSDAWERAVVLMHAHLNLLGWLGLSVIGTQFMLWPAVLRTRMAQQAPAVARRVLIGMVAGLATSVAGLLLSVDIRPVHWLAAAGMTLYTAAVAYSLWPAVLELRAKRPRSASPWALLAGNAWLLAALALDVGALARGPAAADSLLDRVLVPLLGLGVVAQILSGALGFLLPVTVGGGPSGNRLMSRILDYGWPARATLGNVGVLILAVAQDPEWRAAGWLGVIAGFGTFPLFVLAALFAVRRPPRETPGSDPSVRPRTRMLDGHEYIALGSIAVAAVVLALVASGAWPSRAVKSGPGAGTAAQSGVAVPVQLNEFSVSPSVITVAPGADLVLSVRNSGHMTHDLRLDGTHGTRMLAPAQQQTVDFGRIDHDTQAWCTVAGHREAGMTLHIRVVAANPDAMAMSTLSTQPAGVSTFPPPTWRAYDPALRPAAGGTIHDVTLRVQETTVQLAPGVTQRLWTYNGTVPGPVLHGRVGDVFTVHVINTTTMEHSIDFHAGQVAPQAMMKPIRPGGELTYQFTAEHSGIWMYHCGTAPLIQHVAMGMYGAVVIDPPTLPATAASLVMVQSELYLGAGGGVPSMGRLLAAEPDFVVFNGYPNQYTYAPIHVRAGQRVRIWVLDAGPSEPSAFHVVGVQFDTVFKEGAYQLTPGNAAHGAAQELDLQPGEGGFVEFTPPAPGTYTIIDHRLADAQRGAEGTLIADR